MTPNSKQRTIAVVGDLLTDVIVRLNEMEPTSSQNSFRYGTDTDAQILHRRGGSAANLAIGVAKLGWEVAFLGNVGDDFRGDGLVEELKQAGVKTQVTRGGTTGTVVALVDSKGERSMLTDRAAAKEFSAWQKEWLSGVEFLHVPGYSLVVEPLATTTLEIMREFKHNASGASSGGELSDGKLSGGESPDDNLSDSGALRGALPDKVLSLGISSVGAILDYGIDEFCEMATQVVPDLVICNRQEAELIGDRLLASSAFSSVVSVITDGAKPTEILHNFASGAGIKISPPTIPDTAIPDTAIPDTAIPDTTTPEIAGNDKQAAGEKMTSKPKRATVRLDTTGAGDAFSAGLLVGLARGESLESAVQLGHKLAKEHLQNNINSKN